MPPAPEILWTAAFLNERFTSLVSPLGWSFVGSLFEELALRDPLRYMGYPDAETVPATRLWHGHPYVNVEIFQIFYKPFPDALTPADAVRYFPGGDIRYRKRGPYPRSMFQPRFLSSLLFHLARDPLVTSPLNYYAWQQFVPYHDAQICKLKAQLAGARDARSVLRIIEATHALDAQFLHIHRWSLTYADVFYRILTHLTDDAQTLMSNNPNKTNEVNAELAALAQFSPPPSAGLLKRIREQEPVAAAEQQTADALETFLTRHGHRAFSLDIAQPTFRDDPTQLLAFLQVSPPVQDPPTGRPQNTRPNPFLRPLVALTRRYARLREDQRYYWQKSLAVTRSAYMRLGRDLAARELISCPEDIFYATCSEVAAYHGMDDEPDDFSRRIMARKQEWERWQVVEQTRGAAAYPLFLRGDLPVQEPLPVPMEQCEWRGRGVSSGVARGVARIIRDPHELGRVGAGEILIAPSTDPAWTPIFARLKGLALERGGVLSHGAVVAREYRLPAVTGVPNLTHELTDGEWIEVDGTQGVVRRINPEKSSGLLRPAAQ